MKRMLAMLLALLMLSGCTQRAVTPNTTTEPTVPPVEELPNETPEELPPAKTYPPEKPEELPPTEEETPSEPVDEETEERSLLEPANPAAVTEFSSYAALDGTKLGWGPGGPVDELNRSQGALAYQDKYGKYDAHFIGQNNKKIYLSFDQGYENGYTTPILDVLKEKNCPAIFFLTGHYAKSEPELIQRMMDEGHILGSHSTDHICFPDTPLENCKKDIEELHSYVKDTYDYEMSLFRFPAGEFSERTLKLMQDMGYKSVFWSFAYKDWEVDNQPDPATALKTIVSKAHPGAIILLHSVSSTNAQILGQAIDELRAQGYEFASFDENFAAEE